MGEFAAWMRGLHLNAKRPSYTEIARRARTRYPDATVVESTISDTLNGKRLPRCGALVSVDRARHPETVTTTGKDMHLVNGTWEPFDVFAADPDAFDVTEYLEGAAQESRATV